MSALRGLDLNQRPPGYEPDELPDCSTPRCGITVSYYSRLKESVSRVIRVFLELFLFISAENLSVMSPGQLGGHYFLKDFGV